MPPLLIISLIIFKLLYLCAEKQSKTHLTRTPCGGLLEYIYILASIFVNFDQVCSLLGAFALGLAPR
jgi:hypothetical protein